MSRYGVFSGLYFPVFSPTTGKYGPEKASYLDTFHAVSIINVWQGFEFVSDHNLVIFSNQVSLENQLFLFFVRFIIKIMSYEFT